MPVSRAYSFLHELPTCPELMLNRYLGIEAEDTAPQEDQETDEQESRSVVTSKFFDDMTDRSDMRTIRELYEQCGALIEEGFVSSSGSEVEEGFSDDSPAPSRSPNPNPTPPPPSSSPLPLLPPPSVGPSSLPLLPIQLAFDPVTNLPIPPYMLLGIWPEPSTKVPQCTINNFSRFVHLDPTRPIPAIHYFCSWGEDCAAPLSASTTGYTQAHLRNAHGVNDSVDRPIRCQYRISREKNRVCGAIVSVQEIGVHICDEHFLSRMVRCPFCSVLQTCRKDMGDHWESCAVYARAPKQVQIAWRRYWRWPQKAWEVDPPIPLRGWL